MGFLDILGQNRAQKVLKGVLVTQQVSHAYLFVGPGGVGKRKTAHTFAQALNCEAGQNDACGKCPSCQKAIKGVHPDILRVVPDGASIKIDQIRELQKMIRFGPSSSRWLVVIVEDAEKINEQAANSFLKSLEEPAEKVVFILLAHNAQVLPKTVVSRCQTILFSALSEEVVATILQKEGLPQEKARFLAGLAGGGVARAYQLENEFEKEEIEEIFSQLKNLSKEGVVPLFALSKKLEEYRERIDDLLSTILVKYFVLQQKKTAVREIKVVLNTLRAVQKRANLRLALDNMLFGLQEAAYG